MGGGYGVKTILNQQEDIQNTKIKQQELAASEKQKANEIAQSIKQKQEETENTKNTKKKVEEKKKTKNINRNFSKLKAQNKDTVAWLYVPGTDINFPIVQANDNLYYLTHNFDKERSTMGWAFADYHNTFPTLSTNTIMYGHTYKETTIFSKLKRVLKDSWLNNEKKHIITLDTEKERLKFQVFSVYTTKETNNYLQIEFNSAEKYQKYLNRSLKKSIKNFHNDPTINDKILTISTCYTDAHHRLVVQAKLIGPA